MQLKETATKISGEAPVFARAVDYDTDTGIPRCLSETQSIIQTSFTSAAECETVDRMGGSSKLREAYAAILVVVFLCLAVVAQRANFEAVATSGRSVLIIVAGSTGLIATYRSPSCPHMLLSSIDSQVRSSKSTTTLCIFSIQVCRAPQSLPNHLGAADHC